MREILGRVRSADRDFGLIGEGDRVLAALSGGKDSLMLVKALGLYRRFSPAHFTLFAVHLSLGLSEEDTRGLEAFCAEADVPLKIVPTKIGDVVQNQRREKNPCSLCARMRRGRLAEEAKKWGCNKLALGHHADDAMETLLMSVLHEGRMHTFAPVAYMSRSDVTVIRPLVYVREDDLVRAARRLAFPVLKSPCPMDGHTTRQRMKDLIKRMDREMPGASDRLFSALRDRAQYGLWDPRDFEKKPGGEADLQSL